MTLPPTPAAPCLLCPALPALLCLLQAVLPVVRAFPQIETCMECSAQKLQFVGEVFYYALKAGGWAGRFGGWAGWVGHHGWVL